jgi:hypothetical protein
MIFWDQHIKFKNRLHMYFNWINDGIIFINDIVNHEGKLSEIFILKKSPSGVRVTRSLVLYVCFVDRCLSFCTFSFWPLCCLFLYGFWLPLWYLQTLLTSIDIRKIVRFESKKTRVTYLPSIHISATQFG